MLRPAAEDGQEHGHPPAGVHRLARTRHTRHLGTTPEHVAGAVKNFERPLDGPLLLVVVPGPEMSGRRPYMRAWRRACRGCGFTESRR